MAHIYINLNLGTDGGYKKGSSKIAMSTVIGGHAEGVVFCGKLKWDDFVSKLSVALEVGGKVTTQGLVGLYLVSGTGSYAMEERKPIHFHDLASKTTKAMASGVDKFGGNFIVNGLAALATQSWYALILTDRVASDPYNMIRGQKCFLDLSKHATDWSQVLAAIKSIVPSDIKEEPGLYDYFSTLWDRRKEAQAIALISRNIDKLKNQ